jgi:hypothetical protein
MSVEILDENGRWQPIEATAYPVDREHYILKLQVPLWVIGLKVLDGRVFRLGGTLVARQALGTERHNTELTLQLLVEPATG